MISRKQRMPTDASETPHDVGPDVAAEIEKIKGDCF